ncbi:MAG: hypothetical protein IJU29_01130 [Oscillospiraceae bacterium]|nr:hypothetical protein [Oscillospiraceae bacterium]
MKATSAQANKILRQLQEEKELLLRQESQAQLFIAATTEKLEDARPDYDYTAVQMQLREMERKIRAVKHSINTFNVSHTVEGFDLTVDQMLIYLPQLQARKSKLERMAAHGPRERQNTSGRSGIIEYEYANYDVGQVEAELKAVSEEIMRAQLALEQANSTIPFEIGL